MANLKAVPPKEHQWKPGVSGNPAGPKPGYKHLSWHIQKRLNDDKFEATIIDSKKGYVNYKGTPLNAIIQVAMVKASAGDKAWADWLANNGYGQKVVHANDEDNPMPGVTVPAEIMDKFVNFLSENTKQT